jgi:hypothetical protein
MPHNLSAMMASATFQCVMPSQLPPLVVGLICGDPVSGKSCLGGGYVDLSFTDQITHEPLQPILRLSIPGLFNASPRLRPWIGRIVGTAQTKRNKMVNLVIWVRGPELNRIVLEFRPAARKTSDHDSVGRDHTRHRGLPSCPNRQSDFVW